MDFQPLIRALRARLAAKWPEATEIPDVRFADRFPWGDYTLPFGVIAFESAERAERWGSANLGLEPVIDLWYVSEDPDPSTPIDGKLLPVALDLAFSTTLMDGATLAGQVVHIEDISWAADLPDNQRMAALQNRRGGRVRVRCAVVYGAS